MVAVHLVLKGDGWVEESRLLKKDIEPIGNVESYRVCVCVVEGHRMGRKK